MAMIKMTMSMLPLVFLVSMVMVLYIAQGDTPLHTNSQAGFLGNRVRANADRRAYLDLSRRDLFEATVFALSVSPCCIEDELNCSCRGAC